MINATDKLRLRHGFLQVHNFPFSNLNFINHIDSSLRCFGIKERKLKILRAKDGYNFFENEQVKLRTHGAKDGYNFIENDQFESVRMLRDCVRRKSIREGKQIHAQTIKSEKKANVILWTALVNLYAKCGNLVYARQVFDKIPHRNIVSRGAILSAYVQNGYWEDGLKLFGLMRDAHLNEFICSSLLGLCAGIRDPVQGMVLHGMAIKAGFVPNEYVGNALVNMYTKCILLIDARGVFDRMPKRSIVSWNGMLSAYFQNGHWEDGLKLVGVMHAADIKPDEVTCLGLLGILGGMRDTVNGKPVHGMAIKAGFVPYVTVENALVDMYAKCDLLMDSRQLFDKMPERNIVSWNGMLSAYVQNGYWEDALKLVDSMHDANIKPDEFTCSSLLGVFAGMRNPIHGKVLHGMTIKAGFVLYAYVENALIDMYGKCHLLMDARRVFEGVSEPDVVSWTTIIRTYAENKYHEEAIELFSQMNWSSKRANDITMRSLLTACAELEDLQIGKQMHGYIIKSLPDLNVWVETALVTMYSKCGDTEYAFKVFERTSKKNVVECNAMFEGCV